MWLFKFSGDVLILGKEDETGEKAVIAFLLDTSVLPEDDKNLWWSQAAASVHEDIIMEDSRASDYKFQAHHFCFWNKRPHKVLLFLAFLIFFFLSDFVGPQCLS
jgi:hypothetical protein